MASSEEVALGSLNENMGFTLPSGHNVFSLLSLSQPSNMGTCSHRRVSHCPGLHWVEILSLETLMGVKVNATQTHLNVNVVAIIGLLRQYNC